MPRPTLKQTQPGRAMPSTGGDGAATLQCSSLLMAWSELFMASASVGALFLFIDLDIAFWSAFW
jgi:hypothetical protein